LGADGGDEADGEICRDDIFKRENYRRKFDGPDDAKAAYDEFLFECEDDNGRRRFYLFRQAKTPYYAPIRLRPGLRIERNSTYAEISEESAIRWRTMPVGREAEWSLPATKKEISKLCGVSVPTLNKMAERGDVKLQQVTREAWKILMTEAVRTRFSQTQ
jgi:hypothetical protein